MGKYAIGPFFMVCSSLVCTICLWQIGVHTRLAVKSNSAVTMLIQCTGVAHTHSVTTEDYLLQVWDSDSEVATFLLVN